VDLSSLRQFHLVPLTRDTDGRCTTECDGGDWSGEVTYNVDLLIEIVPLTRDTDGRCTTECDSGDWSGEVTYKTVDLSSLR